MNIVYLIVPSVLWAAALIISLLQLRNAKRELSKWRRSHEQLLVSFGNREKALSIDADRVANIVRQYIKDIEETAALLKDDSPPLLWEEREALRLHDEIAKRT